MAKKQVEENQERSISNIAGNIQDVITWLEAMKKDGWETIRLNWDKDLVFTRYRLGNSRATQIRKSNN